MAEIKALQSENESLKSKAAKEALGDVMDQVVEVKGVKLLATKVLLPKCRNISTIYGKS